MRCRLWRMCRAARPAIYAGLLFLITGADVPRSWSKEEAEPDPSISQEEFARKMRGSRDRMISAIPPLVPPDPSYRRPRPSTNYPWKRNIITEVFWVGAKGTRSSCWDPLWQAHYGGVDSPSPRARRDFAPRAFTPRLNSFYVALPYNDVTGKATKPEVRAVVPWFEMDFVKEGQSVCRGRWLQIQDQKRERVCYAQWSDAGPYRVDHWQYVFGNELPKSNPGEEAGMSVSPAVRDYLQVTGSQFVCHWKFVDEIEVPTGPWKK